MAAADPDRIMRLCEGLIAATEAGDVKWSRTLYKGKEEPETTDFITTFKAGRVRVRSRDKDDAAPFRLLFFDAKGERIEGAETGVDSGGMPLPWNASIETLYNLARSQALRITERLDAFLEELPRADGSPE
jgi:hypothetical protein